MNSVGSQLPQRIEVLQAGRALAAIAVVVYHAALAINNHSALLFHKPPCCRHLDVSASIFSSCFRLHYLLGARRDIWQTRSRLDNYAYKRLSRNLSALLPVGCAIYLLYLMSPSLQGASNEKWNTILPYSSFPTRPPAL